MKPAHLRIAVALLCIGAATSGRASADPLVVQEGGWTFAGDPFGLALRGEGFSIGSAFSAPSQMHVLSPLSICGFCSPGMSVDLSGALGSGLDPGSLGAGSATIGGTTFGADENILLGGVLYFDAPMVVIPVLEEEAQNGFIHLTAPFLFHGQVVGYSPDGTGQLFQADLVGRGRVGFRLFATDAVPLGSAAGGVYLGSEVTYRFAPIPEPGTAVLFGIGALLAGGTLRSKIRRRPDPNGSPATIYACAGTRISDAG